MTVLPTAAFAADDCHVGAYRLSDGRLVDIAPSEGQTLRWRMFDGETGALAHLANGSWSSTYGWTQRPDGKSITLSNCVDGRLRFAGVDGRRIPLEATETSFESHGTRLSGRLVLPQGRGRVPIVILVHGAEHDSARQFYFLQRMLPAEGVGAFVYDKRGVGGSGGQYTQDFNLLADDAVAAMHEARRLAGRRAGRIGYQGGSQGGWVAPIAAARAPVDFVIVSFGLAVSVIEEDQEEVALEMALKGHTPEEIAKAQEVAAAAEEVIASAFTQGFDRFDEVRAKYRNAPWYKDLHGNYTWALLPYTAAELREKGKQFIWGTPFHYDPMPTLCAASTPELWILGSDDLEAPSAETSRRIKSLIAQSRPFTLAIEPGAEHGMTDYEMKGEERISTRYSPGYFEMMRDFARDGRLRKPYGRAEISPAPNQRP
ncbi:S9 family peptidase [Caulobacter sp. S45]|uniref:alpha/beta hydrolase family protein n=1 Tax=Caulobacter sp. S45 TaxID=1641861 RepID=UPI00131B0061|nr:alpha/beta hydrolase [Caulobacter sp. S45]